MTYNEMKRTILSCQGFSDMVKGVKENGFVRVENVLSDFIIENLKKEIEYFRSMYSLPLVRSRTFYKREEGENRQGDAFMFSLAPNIALPSLFPTNKETQITEDLMILNNSIIEALIGCEVPDYSRSMINIQEYMKDSFEVACHFDGEFFDFEHVIDDEHDELVLKINSGLLPRYVVVFILENENKEEPTGLYIQKNGIRTFLENKKGDMIIFDNINCRHGVPKLKEKRMMIGFRNFDCLPYYFEGQPEGGAGWIELQDQYNTGWCRKIDSADAQEIMLKFNNKWMSYIFNDYVNQKSAF